MSCQHKPAQYSSRGISLGGVVLPLGLGFPPVLCTRRVRDRGPSCIMISLPFILRKLWNSFKRCDVVQAMFGKGDENGMLAKTNLEYRRLAHV